MLALDSGATRRGLITEAEWDRLPLRMLAMAQSETGPKAGAALPTRLVLLRTEDVASAMANHRYYQRDGEESGGGADRLGRIERSGIQNAEFVSRLRGGVAISRGCEAAPVYGERFRPDWRHPRALTESGRCRCVRIARVRDVKHRTASGSRQKRAVHWLRPDFGCEIKLQILDWHPPAPVESAQNIYPTMGGPTARCQTVTSGRGRAASNYRFAGIWPSYSEFKV